MAALLMFPSDYKLVREQVLSPTHLPESQVFLCKEGDRIENSV